MHPVVSYTGIVSTPPTTARRGEEDVLCRCEFMARLVDTLELWVPVEQDEYGGEGADDCCADYQGRDELRSTRGVSYRWRGREGKGRARTWMLWCPCSWRTWCVAYSLARKEREGRGRKMEDER